MWTLKSLIEWAGTCSTEISGKWVPCRPVPLGGFYGISNRAKAAWAVFTGHADAFTWPGGQ